MPHCKHKINKSILAFEWCRNNAVRDGYCTRHHPSYISPKQRKALDEFVEAQSQMSVKNEPNSTEMG